jgi:sulfur-carrier protein
VKLISINLLGSIKKLIGHSNLQINEEELANVKGIISYLENNYYSNNKINENEILVAINGIESSLLGGHNAKISSGDIVTILSVVHGG